MRLLDRLSLEVAPASVAALLLLGAAGCEQLQSSFSGKSDQGPQLTALRKSIAEYRSRFLTAVSGSELRDVAGLLQEGNRLLDSIEHQAASMSLMDGQTVKMQVAAGRKIIQAARGFYDSNDLDGVRAHRERLDGVLFDIDSVLHRAAMMTDNPPPAGS